MIDDDDDTPEMKKNYKKILTNSISYTINKKMNIYDAKLDNIIKNLENNFDYTKNLIENLKTNNLNLEQKIDNLENKIDILEEKLDLLQNTIINSKNNENITINNEEIIKKINNIEINDKNINDKNIINYKYKELKEESFDLDYNFVKLCLDNANIDNDIKIFKKIYLEDIPKEYYPIRHIKKKFQYWYNGHMVDDDLNGTYVKNVILKNIENCYLKINVIENYSNDMDQFLKNQEHINKLSEEKYKDKFLSKITTLINI
jgi:hypothetical protein